MISIRKYLYGASATKAVDIDPTWVEALFGLVSGLYEAIRQHVLTGDRAEELRSQLAQLEERLRPDLSREEAAEAQRTASGILAAFQVTTQQSATKTATEIQNILGMLNEALMVLAGGSARSVSRLQQIETTLHKASMIQDLVALKSSLADTIDFVKEESAREQETAAKEAAGLEAEFGKARALLGNPHLRLPGRPEGVRTISEALTAVPSGQALYVIAFLLDRLQAIAQRYGPSIADELVFRLVQERLAPVAPDHLAYRWTSSSLVGVFRRTADLPAMRLQVAALNRSPLTYRAALGSRTAVLTVSPSYLVAEGAMGAQDLLIEEVDRFTGFHP